jgi:AcrR family transcriptional regulator
MTHTANTLARPYRSELRAEQAEATRARILDATGRVMVSGTTSVSIPAIAREAGVSVPTVYRHFPTKGDLLEAIYPYVLERAGLQDVPAPRSLDDLRPGVRALFDRTDSFDAVTRAAMASPAAEEVRRLSMPRRLALFRGLLDSVEPKLAEADRDRIARLLVVLTTSAALRTWRDHLDQSVDEAADDVDWVVRAAIGAAAEGSRS